VFPQFPYIAHSRGWSAEDMERKRGADRGMNPDTHLQLHWAAQAAAGAGRTVLPKQRDDSHTNFHWSDGALMQGDDRSGIRFRDLTLVYGNDEFPLTGRTLDDGFRFFEQRVGQTIARPGEATPADHPVAHGALFSPDINELASFASLFAKADRELRRIQEPVRCWPHHFDIATQIDLGEGRTIGIGFLLGDAQYDEPYWYVTPYPYPEDRTQTKPLPSGFWHTEGWLGAVLLESSGANVAEFLDAARSAAAMPPL